MTTFIHDGEPVKPQEAHGRVFFVCRTAQFFRRRGKNISGLRWSRFLHVLVHLQCLPCHISRDDVHFFRLNEQSLLRLKSLLAVQHAVRYEMPPCLPEPTFLFASSASVRRCGDAHGGYYRALCTVRSEWFTMNA